MLNFIQRSARKVYNINATIGIKLITILRLGFSHLRKHKFRHNFWDTLNLLCSGNMEVESASLSFLWCFPGYPYEYWRNIDFRNIDSDLPKLRDENLTNILLYSNHIYGGKTNQKILIHVIRYIKDSQRFEEPLCNPS